ncbi:MAG: hypothetical protein M3460_17975 [Actinomycetota bacterium]|nr:hypothetical protein [Actinomycetota bacterium]
MDGMGGLDGWRPGERAGAAMFSAAMLAAVLSPLLQYRRPMVARIDGFPLSWYPMFSTKRQRRAWVTYAVGVQDDGGRRYLPCGALGPGGLNQVRRQLYRVAVREKRSQAYADALAGRLSRRPDCRDLVRVEILRTRFDLDTCLLNRVVYGEEKVLASAPVQHPVRRIATVPATAAAR